MCRERLHLVIYLPSTAIEEAYLHKAAFGPPYLKLNLEGKALCGRLSENHGCCWSLNYWLGLSFQVNSEKLNESNKSVNVCW